MYYFSNIIVLLLMLSFNYTVMIHLTSPCHTVKKFPILFFYLKTELKKLVCNKKKNIRNQI